MSIAASGFPTMLLLPRITTCFPGGSCPLRTRSSWTPAGVAGTNRGDPMSIRPTFTGWKQSTSFRGDTAATAFSVRICGGRGWCTRGLRAHVPLVSRVLADEDGDEAGRAPPRDQRVDPGLELGPDRVRDRLPVDHDRPHRRLPGRHGGRP